jgi:hypothetical protein
MVMIGLNLGQFSCSPFLNCILWIAIFLNSLVFSVTLTVFKKRKLFEARKSTAVIFEGLQNLLAFLAASFGKQLKLHISNASQKDDYT